VEAREHGGSRTRTWWGGSLRGDAEPVSGGGRPKERRTDCGSIHPSGCVFSRRVANLPERGKPPFLGGGSRTDATKRGGRCRTGCLVAERNSRFRMKQEAALLSGGPLRRFVGHQVGSRGAAAPSAGDFGLRRAQPARARQASWTRGAVTPRSSQRHPTWASVRGDPDTNEDPRRPFSREGPRLGQSAPPAGRSASRRARLDGGIGVASAASVLRGSPRVALLRECSAARRGRKRRIVRARSSDPDIVHGAAPGLRQVR
jgi:hypothetical protein